MDFYSNYSHLFFHPLKVLFAFVDIDVVTLLCNWLGNTKTTYIRSRLGLTLFLEVGL